jgi:hypothetical protein
MIMTDDDGTDNVLFVCIDTETSRVLGLGSVNANYTCTPDFHKPDNTDTDPNPYYDEGMAQDAFWSTWVEPELNMYRIPELVFFMRVDTFPNIGDLYSDGTFITTDDFISPPRPWDKQTITE